MADRTLYEAQRNIQTIGPVLGPVLDTHQGLAVEAARPMQASPVARGIEQRSWPIRATSVRESTCSEAVPASSGVRWVVRWYFGSQPSQQAVYEEAVLEVQAAVDDQGEALSARMGSGRIAHGLSRPRLAAPRVARRRRAGPGVPSRFTGWDTLDIAVLRSLVSDIHRYPARSEIRESSSSLARKLRVSEAAVRKRISSFSATGFQQGWVVMVNPGALGEKMGIVRLEVRHPRTKEDVVRELQLLEDLWYIIDYWGPGLTISFYFRDERSLRRRIELFASIANAERVDFGEIGFPRCGHRFSRIDLAIVRAMWDSPNESYGTIARRAGFSPRTVKRRLDRMIAAAALFVVPRVDLTALRGMIPGALSVFYEGEEGRARNEPVVLSLVGSRVLAPSTGAHQAWIPFVMGNLSEGRELLARVGQLVGVRAAYLDVAVRHLWVARSTPEHLDTLSRPWEVPRKPRASRL